MPTAPGVKQPTASLRHLIYCDCCGQEGLAAILSDCQSVQLEIRARRHGVWHTVTLDLAVLAECDLTQYALTEDRHHT